MVDDVLFFEHFNAVIKFCWSQVVDIRRTVTVASGQDASIRRLRDGQ